MTLLCRRVLASKALADARTRRYAVGMTEPLATSRIRTQSRSLGRSTPRQFSKTAWWRFAADRRRRYVARIIPGTPTDAQAALIQSLIRLEWSALKHEAAGTLASDKVALDARRLFQRLLLDFERSLAPKPLPPAKTKPGPPQITLEEHLAMLRELRDGPA